MTMTDPIADMLTRIRNANSAYHDTVTMPHSKLKAHVAEILQQEGYIAGWSVADAPDDAPGRILSVDLKYGPNRDCGSTPRPTPCPRSSAASVSRSSRPRPAC
jgi:small subunit ribosomal protein S8